LAASYVDNKQQRRGFKKVGVAGSRNFLTETLCQFLTIWMLKISTFVRYFTKMGIFASLFSFLTKNCGQELSDRFLTARFWWLQLSSPTPSCHDFTNTGLTSLIVYFIVAVVVMKNCG